MNALGGFALETKTEKYGRNGNVGITFDMNETRQSEQMYSKMIAKKMYPPKMKQNEKSTMARHLVFQGRNGNK